MVSLRLFDAAGRGDLAGVEAELRRHSDGAATGANVNARDEKISRDVVARGETDRSCGDRPSAVGYGSGQGNPRQPRWHSAHDASWKGHLEVARELVRDGANIFAQTQNGSTPFDFSASNAHDPSVSEFLLQHYRETIFASEGRRALLTILKEGNYCDDHVVLKIGRRVSVEHMLGLVIYFVEQDPDCVREQDDNGDLPLHIAVCKSAPLPVIQYLIQQDSATLYISNQEGELPIHLACGRGAHACLRQIKCLVEANGGAAATLGTCDKNGFLPLHALLCGSIKKPELKMVEYVVQSYRAALSHRTLRGDLPMTLAAAGESSSASLSVIFTCSEVTRTFFRLERNGSNDYNTRLSPNCLFIVGKISSLLFD